MGRKTYKKDTILIDDMQVLVSWKRVKNYYLHVTPPDGQVVVTVRIGTSEHEIKRFVEPKKERIKGQIKRFTWEEKTLQRAYESGEMHYFAGEKYPLLVEQKARWFAKIVLQENAIVFYQPAWYTREQKERAMNNRYRKQLENILPPLVEKYGQIVGIHVPTRKIKKMKSVWWLAHITKKSITINLELMKKSQPALEYIIVHELVHFLEKNHTKKFYQLVEQFMPDRKECKKMLSLHTEKTYDETSWMSDLSIKID